jgi:AcrR family transcriptional regulator
VHALADLTPAPAPARSGRGKAGPDTVDGRTERAARTRERIIAAILDLVRAGNLNPTAEEVAQYAVVGHRTVFRHFQDMETLYDEMNARVRVHVEAGLSASPVQTALADRIEALAAERAATFELITMYYLSGDIRMHSSPTLKRHRAQFARLLRTQLLAHLPEVEPAVEAADLLTSVDGWLRLRRTQKLSVERARRVTIEALTALVPPA